MSWTLQDFRDAVREDLGEEVGKLVNNPEIDRWVNQAKDLLGVHAALSTDLSWDAGATTVDLPDDFLRVASFICSTEVPAHRVWGRTLVILSASGAPRAGSATLLYHGYFPAITGSAVSQLTDVANYACVSYALYRFFKRLASSRSDYRKYATLTGSNGVDLDELDGLSERHYADFEAVKGELEVPEPVAFYEG